LVSSQYHLFSLSTCSCPVSCSCTTSQNRPKFSHPPGHHRAFFSLDPISIMFMFGLQMILIYKCDQHTDWLNHINSLFQTHDKKCKQSKVGADSNVYITHTYSICKHHNIYVTAMKFQIMSVPGYSIYLQHAR